MAAWLKIKNWNNFQHYKDRNPPWIKLHRALLDDYAFAALPDAQKAHLVLLWLFAASQAGGRIPNDAPFLSRKLGTTEQINLESLVADGFLILEQIASDAIADCKQGASDVLALARSREAEAEAESKAEDTADKPPVGSKAADHCPHQQIIDLYHEILPMGRQVKFWNAPRQAKLKARWREDTKRQAPDWWRKLFAYIAESDFLTGRAHSTDRQPFEIDLEWIVTNTNFVKILEGKYENREAA
jgi:hypothetical protein